MLLSTVFEAFLRVPLLFAMEAISKNGLAKISSSVFITHPDNCTDFSEKVVIIQWNELLKYISMFGGFMILLMMLMTHRKFLFSAYMWALSLCSIMTTYAWNQIYVRYCTDIVATNSSILIHLITLDREAIKYFMGDMLIAGISARVFYDSSKWLYRNPNHSFLEWTFLSATPLSLFVTNPRILLCIPEVAALPSLGFLFWKLSRKDSFNTENIRQNNEYHVNQIFTVNIPLKESLVIYWILRAIGNVLVSLEHPVSTSFLLENILVNGCESYISVIGFANVASFLSICLLHLVRAFLLMDYDEPPIGIDMFMTFIFLMLALKANLLFLEPQEKLEKVLILFCIALYIVLYFVHLSAHKAIMLLVSHNVPYGKHIRALSVCFSLITATYLLLLHLWHLYPRKAWILVQLLYYGVLFMSIIITLVVYCLNMVDSFKDNHWEQCEEYLYYVTSFGHLVKFLESVFRFVVDLTELSFSLSGVVTFFLLCLQVYLNIWCQAVDGIRSLSLRSSLKSKINSLAVATQVQLQDLQDVCSICYQPMTKARKSPCNHYFHEACLMKLLYHGDNCPLCNSKLLQQAL